jgi:hypothetical protein
MVINDPNGCIEVCQGEKLLGPILYTGQKSGQPRGEEKTPVLFSVARKPLISQCSYTERRDGVVYRSNVHKD